jgi:hypothetical protein
MNHAFSSAAALAVATGLAHTVIGEILIFRRMRRGTFVPTFGGDVLRERHVRILWASWHALTLLAWAMAAMLVVIASSPENELSLAITRLISLAMGTGALAVLVGTRGRHPGWIAMLVVASLIEFGR